MVDRSMILRAEVEVETPSCGGGPGWNATLLDALHRLRRAFRSLNVTNLSGVQATL